MMIEITEALKEADTLPQINSCCVTGNGRYYSSGNDLMNYANLNNQNNEDDDQLIKEGVKIVRFKF
jgi:enoyl-CoA hydratase/carnithine racemase